MATTAAAPAKRWAREYETIYILRPDVDNDVAEKVVNRAKEVIARLERDQVDAGRARVEQLLAVVVLGAALHLERDSGAREDAPDLVGALLHVDPREVVAQLVLVRCEVERLDAELDEPLRHRDRLHRAPAAAVDAGHHGGMDVGLQHHLRATANVAAVAPVWMNGVNRDMKRL